jgi:hypothetical protein
MLPMLTSVPDILHFATDPDPGLRIRTSDYYFYSAYYFLKVHLNHSSQQKSHKNSRNQGVFLLFLLDDGLIRIRIRGQIRIRTRTSDYQIRIRETQKVMDPTDPDAEH